MKSDVSVNEHEQGIKLWQHWNAPCHANEALKQKQMYCIYMLSLLFDTNNNSHSAAGVMPSSAFLLKCVACSSIQSPASIGLEVF